MVADPEFSSLFSSPVVVAGFKLAEKLGAPKRKVIGIDASATVPQTFDQILRITKATGVKIGLEEGDITEHDIILDDRYHGGVYGVPDERTIEAIKFGASTEAFITDPGKYHQQSQNLEPGNGLMAYPIQHSMVYPVWNRHAEKANA